MCARTGVRDQPIGDMVHTLLPQRQNRAMTITTYFENKATVIEDDDD